MAKKTKSKSRLDKFYKIAKEQGFRSRAAFKLIQLNKKHNFLQSAHVLIDLCAAPGGWLQVAAKYMPSDSIILGVDLDPIRPIPNVRAFQADITSPECLALIRREIRHFRADVVLNDGAPNVGSSWAKDAYSQAELAMHALKLATGVLKKNGVFVTKIFRSTDYNNLIWLFGKFFSKVEATKPEASRANSAEIFVVCQGYLAPDIIDPRFFDPKFVFKNSENDILAGRGAQGVNSIKKIFEVKKRRSIAENTPLTMYKVISLNNFVRCENPYSVFAEFNKIEINSKNFTKEPTENEETIDFGALVKFPDDFKDMCDDLKLLNKKQVATIIKWRAKVVIALNKLKKSQTSHKQISHELQENEEKEEKEDQIQEDEYLKSKQEERAERKLKEKQILKFVKTKLINDSEVVGGENDEELADFEFGNFARQLRKGKYFEVEEEKETGFEKTEDKIEKKKKKINSFNEMSDNIEFLYEQRRQKSEAKNKDLQGKSTEIVSMIAQKKEAQRREKNPEKSIFSSQNKLNSNQQAQNVSDKTCQKFSSEQLNFDILQNSKWFSKKIFSILKDQQTDTLLPPSFKNNPQVQKTVTQQTLEECSSQEEAEQIGQNLQSDLNFDALLEDKGPSFGLGKMTDDDLAETLALAKKMLRKKQRRELIDASYNRYNYPEDPSQLPAWFYEDEKKHSGPLQQVTKEEIQAEKERLLLLRNRLPKKVMEAKYRKKKKIISFMKKAKTEATEVYENEGLSPFSKARAISQIYRKAIRKSKPKQKSLIVSKKHFSAAPRKKSGRKFKMVDRRLKKDLRAQKLKKTKSKHKNRF